MLVMQQPNKLEPFIAKLLQSPYYAVRIADTDKGLPLATNKTAVQMGDVNAFFNGLYENGVKNIVIQGRRKNGSSWKDDGEPVQISFEPNPQPEQPAYAAPPTHQPPAQDFQLPGLNGGLMQGLNAQMVYHHMDYPKILAENVSLKAENNGLKKDIETLKHEALETRFSDAKATGNKEMLTGIIEVLGPIASNLIAAKIGGGAPAAIPGLGNPPAGLSEVKQMLIEMITHAPDFLSEHLYDAAVGISKSQEFAQEFANLLTKYNQIINQDA